MSFVKKYVKLLEISQLIDITESYEKFEKDGMIGDEPIRTHTKQMLELYGIDSYSALTIFMEKLAFESYRELYYHFHHEG